MEPAFYRGDLLFLYNDGGKYNVGDIVVFELKGKEIPIVHRIIKVHEEYDFHSSGCVTKHRDTRRMCAQKR